MMACIRLTAAMMAIVLLVVGGIARGAELNITTPMSPPNWALLERELFRANEAACREYFARFFDDRGYLECVERWGGDDGPDDAIENLTDWPLLHMLGGGDVVKSMYLKAWEGHLRQFTAAKTTEVEFARDGMYYREFPVMMDWLHNAEGLTVFNMQGLSAPGEKKFAQRVRRFADFYVPAEDNSLNKTASANYDARHKIIVSLFNGSRGPLLRKATALDWAGDPIEIEDRFKPGHGERNFAEMLEHFKDYTETLGDHPQNLMATSLALNAFAATHEEKYRRWLLEYVDAWCERAAANNGLLPSNVGRNGKIGGDANGKWFGGTYGWGFTVIDPVNGHKAHRNTVRLALGGFGNALLLTGDQKYVDVWRRQMDAVNSQARVIDGKKLTPHMFGDDGWYDFQAKSWDHGALEVAYWSMKPDDLSRVDSNPWLSYLSGKNPDYPESALRADLARIRQRATAMREDTTTPDTRLSDDPMKFNPCSIDSLLHLACGGIPVPLGSALHVRLRYFDLQHGRPGLPAEVAALVDRLTDDEVRVTLVNVHQTETRAVVVQSGAYGEHHIESLSLNGASQPINDRRVVVRLAPGCGGSLVLKTKRFQNILRFD
ncbi:MAG: hypothetical protein NT013_16240 [Planctomycetia bacterium]|nr:hypothetical protein [Planctomycetia bacterium]